MFVTWQTPLRAFFAGTYLLSAGPVTADGPPSDPDRPLRNSDAATTPLISEGAVGGLFTRQNRPIAGAMISATSLDRPPKPVPDIAILTDADGAFVWPLQPGAYRLSAVVDSRPIATAEVKVRPGEVMRVDLQAAR
jgi:hypothetical protein